jgi:hypothetical protein
VSRRQERLLLYASWTDWKTAWINISSDMNASMAIQIFGWVAGKYGVISLNRSYIVQWRSMNWIEPLSRMKWQHDYVRGPDCLVFAEIIRLFWE